MLTTTLRLLLVKASKNIISKAKVAKNSHSLRKGGRAKGTPNKRTLILNDILMNLGHDVPQKLVALMPKLSPDKQADVYLKLMEFLYPKRKAIDVAVEKSSGETDIEAQRQRIIKIMQDPKGLECAEYLVELEGN